MDAEEHVSKQQFLLFFWDRIREYLSNRNGYSIDDFVVLEKTFPDCIKISNFSPSDALYGKKIDCSGPQVVKIDQDTFPILEALSEEELTVFSPANDADFSLETAVYGPMWEMTRVLGESSIRTFLSLSEDNYRNYVFVKIALNEDGRVTGSPLKQFLLRLAAIRLFNLVRHYDLFLRNEMEFRRTFRGNLTYDTFGNEIFDDITDGISKTLKRLRFDHDWDAVVDIAMFSSMPEAHDGDDGDWQTYEENCAKAFRDLGFDVSLTKSGRDYGADIICEKDGLTYLVQCKFYNKPVGVKAVQEIVAARQMYAADYCVVMCESGFTSAAQELARRNNVLLSDIRATDRVELNCIAIG